MTADVLTLPVACIGDPDLLLTMAREAVAAAVTDDYPAPAGLWAVIHSQRSTRDIQADWQQLCQTVRDHDIACGDGDDLEAGALEDDIDTQLWLLVNAPGQAPCQTCLRHRVVAAVKPATVGNLLCDEHAR